MKELSRELQQLKENPKFLNATINSSRAYQGKLSKLKIDLELSKEQYDNQEILHKEEIKQLLNTHKEQLGNYLNIISAQKDELTKSNKVINDYKKEANILKVFL